MTQTQITVLRRDYLEITGNFCAAKLIDYFEKWRRWKVKYHRTEWIYQPLRRIREDLMNEYSKPVISKAIATLENLGLIERRQNPGNRQDKTWQYKLNTDKLKELLCHRNSTSEFPESKNCHSESTVEQYHKFNTESSNLGFYPVEEKNQDVEINQEEETFSEIKEEITQEPETKEEIFQKPQVTHEVKRSAPPAADIQNCAVWEISPGHPYPVFLNWWAKNKYESQGDHWAKDALGNAYSELYRNKTRTTVAIYPQFLEYMKRSTDNCDLLLKNGSTQVFLPSCFVLPPEATEENNQVLMGRVRKLVDQGVPVALPQNYPHTPTPASFTDAADRAIKPFEDEELDKQLEQITILKEQGMIDEQSYMIACEEAIEKGEEPPTIFDFMY
ncbi:MAG: MarR family transcriptional regulator [Nostocales cyanobacterium]|nr:MAG: MarR family transcriptional regulator [Nostocales cyanobacterium]TAF13797.1 MAG: MarR family transcriptional regulator [Nostocales cyanobacterium]